MFQVVIPLEGYKEKIRDVNEFLINNKKMYVPHLIYLLNAKYSDIKWEMLYLSNIDIKLSEYGWVYDKSNNPGSIGKYKINGDLVEIEFKDPEILDLYGLTKPNILSGINDSGKRITYGENMAIREPTDGKGRFDLITPFGLERLAKWYELGSKKYTERNWEKGIPFSRYIDSALRHINKYVMGMTDEDHLAAAAWNILCIMHHEEIDQKDLDNMPHYIKEEK